jgi:hypothetical protein
MKANLDGTNPVTLATGAPALGAAPGSVAPDSVAPEAGAVVELALAPGVGGGFVDPEVGVDGLLQAVKARAATTTIEKCGRISSTVGSGAKALARGWCGPGHCRNTVVHARAPAHRRAARKRP